MKRVFLILLLAAIPFTATAKKQKIKLSILAPEGTTWMETMNTFNRELKAKTNGALQFKIYSGGVSGDELDVIRKMRVGQIHAAAFTGVGLGQILPEIRVIELPFTYQSYDEVDYIEKSLQPHFEKQFDKKGYVFLGFAEAGFVNIFSRKPITSRADLKSVKMWAWEGDLLVKELAKAYQLVPVSLSVTDVLTSLQTGLIDSFYAPPLGAIALQWFTKVKYMTQPQMTNATGAIILTKKYYNKIPEKNQKILKELSKKYSRIIIDRTRKDNEKSYAVLKKNGITFVRFSDAELEKMRETAKKVQDGLVGKLYPKSLLDRMLSLLNTFRSTKAAKKGKKPVS